MLFIAAVALLLAFANGANDNFKGVATLLGSGTAGYRKALFYGTLTTALGSLAAILFAGALIARFQGKGIVSADLVGDPSFAAAVAIGASVTVLIATRLGMPTSTTHALIGALIGAGLASGGPIHYSVLGEKLLLPLLLSPVIALLVTALLYPLLKRTRERLGVTRESCLCVGEELLEPVPELSMSAVAQRRGELSLSLGKEVECRTRYHGQVLGVRAPVVLNGAHYLSAGAMSFARGLNDTPKIAALLLVLPAMATGPALLLTGLAIGLGGLTAARRVAHTMARRITPMNAGQGFTANFVSASLILGASRFGMPVSTTHVSCGSIFGLGLTTGGSDGRVVRRILGAWVITLPLAGLIAAAARSLSA